ncbi:hypothetical protein HYP05_gp009 [Salmonella phage ST-W77]|uniref:Uncharacterized protein n=1 Tax=Salmonella phage ST-W77 TaxID=1897742 RepID=A0A678NXP6_9CAUD|nr:hypothetical protein HYP05_gp009 [Salmonella phage ST-W77]ARB12163.1 hypothetical protein STW77_0009 [Salmonella phage ST-W77]EKE9231628.1 hypothetical protein [Salmonella enterica]
MKPFIEYFKEQAQQPQTHGGIQGKSVTITKQADGTQWCTGATVTQITPDNQADVYNLELTNGNTIKVKLTPDQTHGITQGQEVVAVHDGFEFFFGKSADKGQVTEAYAQELANMDKMIGKALGVGKSRKSGRTEFEYSGIPGIGKPVAIDFGGEDDPYVIVTVAGKQHDISKGKTLAADIAKYIGVKPV